MVKALILAAGYGTRLRPLSDSVPKCLVPILGRPLLSYWVDRLAACGVGEVVVNTHAQRERVAAFIRRVNERDGIRITEAYEPELLGTAGTIRANKHIAETSREALVIYGDNLSASNLSELLEYHRRHADPITMQVFQPDNPQSCGIAILDDDDRVIDFVEKPSRFIGDLANAGVFVMDSSVFDEIAEMRGRDLSYDVLPLFLGRIRAWRSGAYHRDIGTPDSYHRANTDAPRVLNQLGYSSDGRRAAVFFDGDGTLMEFVPYLSDPRAVRIADGAVETIVRLRSHGFAIVIVTTQGATDRDILTIERLRAINVEVQRQFARANVGFDGIYCDSAVPMSADRKTIDSPDRKPGPCMLLRAAADLALSLDRSWIIGDTASDLLTGKHAGCRGGVLLRASHPTPLESAATVSDFPTASTLRQAADLILGKA